MLQGEHSAILSTFIKLPFVVEIFVLSIFEWPLKTGFTVPLECQTVFYPDQALHFVGPDLCPNCLERLSVDIIGRERVKLQQHISVFS